MILSPRLPQSIAAVPEILHSAKPAPDLPLCIGEQVKALILSMDSQQKVLLQIKNTVVAADSQLPLQKGEILTLRVEQLNPALIFKVMTQDTPESQQINNALRMFRSNPEALKDWIISAKDILNGNHLKELTDYIGKKDLQTLQKALGNIIMTKDNLKNPLFIKNYIASLGLTLEKTLRQALSNATVIKNEQLTDNLKLLLLKTESMLQNLPPIPSEHEGNTAQLIKSLLNLVEVGGKVIEHLQIFNCLAQEQDNLFVLQIAFQFPDGIRMQDIFIEADRQKKEAGSEASYRVVIFLDMDILGEVVCDIHMKDHYLNCTLKSKEQDICDFLSGLLIELRDKLFAAGYDGATLTCALDRDIAAWRRDYISKHTLFSQHTINVSI